MRIHMLTLAAGPEGTLRPGEEYEVPDAFGTPLVAGGYAEAVVEPRPRGRPRKATDDDFLADPEPASDHEPATAAGGDA